MEDKTDKEPIHTLSKEEMNSILNKNGDLYIPPYRMNQIISQIRSKNDTKSTEYQRCMWDLLSKSINGIINKINVSNMRNIIIELFNENLLRGRGLLIKAIMRNQLTSPNYTPTFACLICVLNSKLPFIGNLFVRRYISLFKKAYSDNNKIQCIASTKMIAHLINYRIVDSLLAFEILLLLIENMSNDSLELACSFLIECGEFLSNEDQNMTNDIFEKLRAILEEGNVDKRLQYIIENLLKIRKNNFKEHESIKEDLDLVGDNDMITHRIFLDDEIKTEDELNFFRYDEKYDENEKTWKKYKECILGPEQDEEKKSVEEENSANNKKNNENENNENDNNENDKNDNKESNKNENDNNENNQKEDNNENNNNDNKNNNDKDNNEKNENKNDKNSNEGNNKNEKSAKEKDNNEIKETNAKEAKIFLDENSKQILANKNISIKEFFNSLKMGFDLAVKNGPLCEENMYGVIFVIEFVQFKPIKNKENNNSEEKNKTENDNNEKNTENNNNENISNNNITKDDLDKLNNLQPSQNLTEKENSETSPEKAKLETNSTSNSKSYTADYGPLMGQIMSSIKECCRKAYLCAEPRLYEAYYLCVFQINQDCVGKVYSVIGKRRGEIINEIPSEENIKSTIEAILPVAESFGFVEELRKKSSGLVANPMLQFYKWKMLNVDPFDIVSEEDILNYGVNVDTKNIAKNYINKIRQRKGLLTDEKIVTNADKQRNLARKK